jgi:hypothetical protein
MLSSVCGDADQKRPSHSSIPRTKFFASSHSGIALFVQGSVELVSDRGFVAGCLPGMIFSEYRGYLKCYIAV